MLKTIFNDFPDLEEEPKQEEEKVQNYSIETIPKDHSLYGDLKDLKT